jgi:hypothetical protein
MRHSGVPMPQAQLAFFQGFGFLNAQALHVFAGAFGHILPFHFVHIDFRLTGT